MLPVCRCRSIVEAKAWRRSLRQLTLQLYSESRESGTTDHEMVPSVGRMCLPPQLTESRSSLPESHLRGDFQILWMMCDESDHRSREPSLVGVARSAD